MKRIQPYTGKIVASAFAAILCSVASAPVSAQAMSSPVQDLIDSFHDLQSDIAALQSSVDSLGTVGNVAVTPPVIVKSGILDCIAINAADTDRNIAVDIVNAGTGASIVSVPGLGSTQPGRVTGIGLFSPSAFSGFAFCRFTVLNGTKADIRGSVLLTPNTGGDDTTAHSIAAE